MAPKKADEYGANELVEAAGNMRLDTAKRLLEEEEGGKNRSTVVNALTSRIETLEAKAAENGGSSSSVPDDEDLPEGAKVTIERNAVGPTASQKEGFTPTAAAVEKAKAAGEVPVQGLEFTDPPKADEVQLDPHGSGAARAEAAAAQVDASLADGEGPYLGTGVGKVAPPAPAFAPGEPDPSGSHAAGMTARALGAAPPAPTRFDGKDTGLAPRPEVGLREEVAESGGEASEADPDEGEPTTEDGSTVVHE